MARRRTSTGASEAELGADTRLLEADLEAYPEDKLAQFFGEHADDTRYSVYECDPDNRERPAFLFSFAATEAPEPDALLTQLRETYGAGVYEISARDPDTGQYTFRSRFNVGSRRERRNVRVVPEAEKSAPPPPAPPPQPAGINPELATVLGQQNKILESLAEALTSRPERPEKSTIEIAQELIAIRDLFPREEPRASTSLIEELRGLLKLKDELRGFSDESSASPMERAFDRLAPTLQRALERLSGSGAPTPTNPARPIANGEDRLVHTWIAELQRMAEAEMQPEQAAYRVLEVLGSGPELIEQFVLNVILQERERAAARLIQMAPQMAQHQSWLIEVAQRIEGIVRHASNAAPDETAEHDGDTHAA